MIIEIQQPGELYPHLHRFDRPAISLGRGFENDVILTDPFVSEKHILIQDDQEGWIVKDNDSRNGMYVEKLSRVEKEVRLVSGEAVVIGKTRIRLYAVDHKIAPTRRLISNHTFLRSINNKVNTSYAIAGLLVLYTIEATLMSRETDMAILKSFMLGVLMLFLATVWAGIWALIGKVARHRPRFLLNLTLACFFNILLIPLFNVAQLIGFLFSDPMVESVLFYLLLGVMFAFFLVGHLAVSTTLNLRTRLKFSIGTTGLILSVVAMIFFAVKDNFHSNPKIYGTLKPPFIKTVQSSTIDAFLKESERVFIHKIKKKN